MAQITRSYGSGDTGAGATVLGAHFNVDLTAIFNEFNGNIDDSNIKSGANIAETKLASGIRPRVISRQGGSATDWTVAGASTQTVIIPKIQVGCGVTSGGEQSSGVLKYSVLTVTFPTAYTNPPIVIANSTTGAGYCKVVATNTGFTLTNWSSTTGVVDGQNINWLAIGE